MKLRKQSKLNFFSWAPPLLLHIFSLLRAATHSFIHTRKTFFIFPFKHRWKKTKSIFIFFIFFWTHYARKIKLSGCLRGNFSGHLIILGKKQNKVQHSNKIKLIDHLILLLGAKEIESKGYSIFLDLGLWKNWTPTWFFKKIKN